MRQPNVQSMLNLGLLVLLIMAACATEPTPEPDSEAPAEISAASPTSAPLADWTQENITQELDVQEVSESDGRHGPMIMAEYRLDEPEGSCALAVVHAKGYFYTVEYCLLDHSMGEDDGIGGIRLFAESDYEPVDLLLEQFLQGVELHGQPILTSP